jgi:hypothetical protein
VTLRLLLGICSIIALAPPLMAQGRDRVSPQVDSAQVARMFRGDSAARAWYHRMITPGVQKDSGRFVFDDEVRDLIADPIKRHTRLKPTFSWSDVKTSLENGDLRYASWQLINLYASDTVKVLRIFLRYDEIIPADTLVTTAYYTYALLDPRITRFENGKPVIIRPDILEDIFASMHSIVGRILDDRNRRRAAGGR